MNAMKKGLVAGFLAATLTGCDGGAPDFWCKHRALIASVYVSDAKSTILIRQNKVNGLTLYRDVSSDPDAAEKYKSTASAFCKTGFLPAP